MTDRASAFGRGLAQGASGGWSDEAFSKLLSSIPFDDGTGIERNYKAGSAEQDYLNTERAANAEAQRKYPANFASGAVLGGLAPAIASGGSGGLGAVAGGVGLGALTGAGQAEEGNRVRGAIGGGALGGAAGAAGNLASAAAPALKQLFKQGPPSGPQLAPATAGASTSGANIPRPSPQVGPQLNMAESVPSMPSVRPRSIPPSSLDAAEVEARAALRRADAMDELRKRSFRPPSGPLDEVPSQIPQHERLVADKTMYRDPKTGETAEANIFKRAPEQTETSVLKTVRPPRRPKVDAPVEGAEKIGEGHARTVYDDKGQALKVAKKAPGLAQNKAEATLSGRSEVLNPVLDHAPDYSWVKQRMVTPLDEESMAKHTAMPEADVGDRLRQMAQPDFEGPWPTLEAQELQERARQVLTEVPELDYRDIGKPQQWGLDKNGKPVLIDYGFLKAIPLGIAGLSALSDEE